MRILIVTPRQPLDTGNSVTARRYEQALRQRGHELRVVETSVDETVSLRRVLDEFRPDLAHLLHAYRTGRPWLACGADSTFPFVVTLTGTDINQDIEREDEGPTVHEVLQRAAAVITQNRLTASELLARPESWTCKVHYLPPATRFGGDPWPLRRLHGIPAETVLFLHPAGLRRVKGSLELLLHFDAVADRRPGALLAFCGPVLDDDYAARLFRALAERSSARYLGVIPNAAMAAALAEADVVLNNSLSEGLPNALVEAAALGRPILARDIPGNRAVVEAGVNGLLYRGGDEFVRQALALIDGPDLRRKLTRPRPESFDPVAEGGKLEAIYFEALGMFAGNREKERPDLSYPSGPEA